MDLLDTGGGALGGRGGGMGGGGGISMCYLARGSEELIEVAKISVFVCLPIL